MFPLHGKFYPLRFSINNQSIDILLHFQRDGNFSAAPCEFLIIITNAFCKKTVIQPRRLRLKSECNFISAKMIYGSNYLTRSDGRVVRASAPGALNLGLISSRVKPMTLKLVFTASWLTLSIKSLVCRTSRQVYLLCRWKRHLAKFLHLDMVVRWSATPKRVCIAHR